MNSDSESAEPVLTQRMPYDLPQRTQRDQRYFFQNNPVVRKWNPLVMASRTQNAPQRFFGFFWAFLGVLGVLDFLGFFGLFWVFLDFFGDVLDLLGLFRAIVGFVRDFLGNVTDGEQKSTGRLKKSTMQIHYPKNPLSGSKWCNGEMWWGFCGVCSGGTQMSFSYSFRSRSIWLVEEAIFRIGLLALLWNDLRPYAMYCIAGRHRSARNYEKTVDCFSLSVDLFTIRYVMVT